MQEFKIGANEAGQRLDKFLHKYLKEANTGFLHKMLRKKNITLNKKKAEGKEILNLDDVIQFFFSDETFYKFRGILAWECEETKLKPADSVEPSTNDTFFKQNQEYRKAYEVLKNIKIIYEDDHIILVNKPAGILSQKSLPKDLSLNEWLIGYLLTNNKISEKQLETYKPSICNRLDRNTSGIVICSKSLLGSQTMNQLIKERKVRKFYRTFVKGKIEKSAFIKGYIKKNNKTNKVTFKESLDEKNEKDFMPIETAYSPINCYQNFTYLEVELITGKTHQIRVHLAANGHPLLGDEKYGDRNWNRSFHSVKLPGWQLLHSYRLEFPKLEGDFAHLSQQVYIAEEPTLYHKLKETF